MIVARASLLAAALIVAAALAACGSDRSPLEPDRRLTIGREYAELVVPKARAPRGTIVLLHKGGWAAEGRAPVEALRRTAHRFAGWSWRALSTTYRNGRAGLLDAEAAVDYAARRFGGPICTYGESSGGHWALMAALARPRVRCVIAAAAPTDLAAWPGEVRLPSVRAFTRRTVRAVFGTDRAALRRMSPARAWPRRPHARLFLLYARDDPVVPPAQGVAMHRRVPRSALYLLPAGRLPWVHSGTRGGRVLDGVNPRALESNYESLRRAVQRVAAP